MGLINIVFGLNKALYLLLRSFGRTIATQIRWYGLNIGYNTAISKDCVFAGENVIGQNCIISQTSFGRASYCAHNVVVTNAEVGAYSSIASNVSIGLHSHPTRGYISTFPGFHFRWPATPYLNKPKEFKVLLKTKIGNDVWIGDSAKILSGISIGDGAIVGAGAIVTHDVPPYAIVGGVPAKILRYRFPTDQIEFLLRKRWWEWPIDGIAKNQEILQSEEAFFDDNLRIGNTTRKVL